MIIEEIFRIQGQVAAQMTCIQLHKRAERIGCMLMDKAKLNTGDHVALLYQPGLDLVCAFYGCLYAGEQSLNLISIYWLCRYCFYKDTGNFKRVGLGCKLNFNQNTAQRSIQHGFKTHWKSPPKTIEWVHQKKKKKN